MSTPPRPKRRIWLPTEVALTASLSALVAALAWVETEAGPDITFSPLYVPLVMAAGWWLGRTPMIIVVLVAVASRYHATIFANFGSVSQQVALVNSFTRVTVFLAIGIMTDRARYDRDRLVLVNAQLDTLLAREARLARKDPLTELPNARAFRELLDVEIARSHRTGQSLCVAYVDVDNFKVVNDLYSHAAGDDLLKKIASALVDCVRRGDVPARLGGDEFAILIVNVRLEAAQRIAQRIIARIRAMAAEYPDSGLGASVGLAYFRIPPASAAEVVKKADRAMYRAKAAGKSRFWVSESPEVHAPSRPQPFA